ncbi:MAG: noncanonical pyrimidine nucleotidase, YjjG family [Flavobacteriaceae bacterium]|nr:noncanonical pyrimidine nucleotidase, YjjG family [Flavobacteriaceae bacterium]|tara:strand:- start:1140 stop:1832 length:693 start_codon:yes stop_codon:yes gene_type:complete
MNKKLIVKDIFFDLDHTLWDFDKNSMLAFKRVFKKFKITIEFDAFLKIYEPINVEYWKKYREDKVSKENLRRGRLIDSFNFFDLIYTTEKIDEIADAYIQELPFDNHLFEGALEILDYLILKYRLHIITNGFEEVQHKKLKNSGIDHYFSTVTTSEEVGLKKPNPKVFLTALNKANSLPTQSVMIGDSLEADILGANNIGMQTIFYNYRNESISKKIKSIDSLLEIKNYL